jgi:hypothetical protein
MARYCFTVIGLSQFEIKANEAAPVKFKASGVAEL